MLLDLELLLLDMVLLNLKITCFAQLVWKLLRNVVQDLRDRKLLTLLRNCSIEQPSRGGLNLIISMLPSGGGLDLKSPLASQGWLLVGLSCLIH